MNGTIYKLTAPSGKSYVGQTWDFERRMLEFARTTPKNQSAIAVAIIKYGWERFRVSVVADGIKTESALNLAKVSAITTYDTLAPNGFNLALGGRGGKLCEQSRAKMSAAHTGKKLSPETRAKLSAARKGKPLSQEWKANISAGNRGKKRSPETRARMSAAHKRRNAHLVERNTAVVAMRQAGATYKAIGEKFGFSEMNAFYICRNARAHE